MDREHPTDAQKPEQAEGSRPHLRTENWRPAVLKRAGFNPRTVVDVGVADGTPQLYEAFPDAYHVLIEPLKKHEPSLQSYLKTHRGEYFLTAIGVRDGRAVIDVVPANPGKSSFLQRTELTATDDPVVKREVPLAKLDSLMRRHNFQAPFSLKIDTEGFEYQVIEGASDFLRMTEFVIAEVSIARRFHGSYRFSDFTELMNENGFFLWDILNVVGKRYVDAVFRRRPESDALLKGLKGRVRRTWFVRAIQRVRRPERAPRPSSLSEGEAIRAGCESPYSTFHRS